MGNECGYAHELVVVGGLDDGAAPGDEPELRVGVHADEDLDAALLVLPAFHFVHHHLSLHLYHVILV